MPQRFIQITFDFKRQPDMAELNETLNKANDWITIAPNCWLLWTSSEADKWYSRVKKHLSDGDRVFICEVNIEDRSGWMPRKFWEFIREHQ